MGEKTRLSENPFMILGVTPRTSAEDLINAADETELLYGIDTQEARDRLLHPAGRLAAEVAFLPGVSEEKIKEIRSYLAGMDALRSEADHKTPEEDAQGEDMKGEGGLFRELPPMPELRMESRLAQFNAAAAFLEYWPVHDEKGAEAAVLSLAGISSGISVDRVTEELNNDRRAGGYEELSGPVGVSSALRLHISEVFAGLGRRCLILPPGEFNLLRRRLAEAYYSGRDEYRHVPALSEMVTTHLAHVDLAAVQTEETIMRCIMEEYKEEEKKIPVSENKTKMLSDMMKSGRIQQRKRQTDELITALRAWDVLTRPERTIAQAGGYMEKGASSLFDDMHAFFVHMLNNCGDRINAMKLVKAMLDVFTDLQRPGRKLLEENAKIIGVRA